jgi:hypothetical protein
MGYCCSPNATDNYNIWKYRVRQRRALSFNVLSIGEFPLPVGPTASIGWQFSSASLAANTLCEDS